ncbi:MAG: glycosyltransferase family 4 protein [Armatimonadaceae bacterium]
MKLLYVSHVDTVVRMMLPHLDGARNAGFTVDVACNITRHGNDVRAHADTVWDLPFRRGPLHPANVAALQQLTRLIREQQYDIVHAHTPSGGIIGRLAATRAQREDGLPLRVYTAHGFHFHKQGSLLGNTLFRAIETVAGQNWSDAVLTINREDYETAKEREVVPEERLFLTRGVGVSVEAFDPEKVSPLAAKMIRDEIGAYDDTLIFTFVGEMIPRKRHPDALEAFAKVHSWYPNSRLLLVGDGVLMEKYRVNAIDLEVANSVHFLGFRRDIPAILAATDIFLFPSAQEGLPCSIQEALCMEVPVVASDVRGNNDLLDPSCGRLVPLGDIKAMANAAVELIEGGAEMRQEMGRAGREKMVREYNRERCVAEWLNIYRQLLDERGIPFPDPQPAPQAPQEIP